jgi:hypothetical protein
MRLDQYSIRRATREVLAFALATNPTAYTPRPHRLHGWNPPPGLRSRSSSARRAKLRRRINR